MAAKKAKKRLKRFKKTTKTGFYKSTKMGANLHFRSSWEEKFYKYLDQNQDVVLFYGEPFKIPFLSGIAKKPLKMYMPDLLVRYADGREEIIEIKPESLKNTDTNKRKFEAARKFCEGRQNTSFIVATEIYLKQLGVL